MTISTRTTIRLLADRVKYRTLQISPKAHAIFENDPSFIIHGAMHNAGCFPKELPPKCVMHGGKEKSSVIRIENEEEIIYLSPDEIKTDELPAENVPSDYPNPVLMLSILEKRDSIESSLLKSGWLDPLQEDPGHGFKVLACRQSKAIVRTTNPLAAYFAFHAARQIIGPLDILHFSDLGAGFGILSFTAALYFNRVSSCEIVPRVHTIANEALDQLTPLGLPKERISLQCQDIKSFPLKLSDVVYSWEPFISEDSIDTFKWLFDYLAFQLPPGKHVMSNWIDQDTARRIPVFRRYFTYLSQVAGIGIFQRNSREYRV
ncbi:MAG: hypothetical protein WC890_05685 [Candidatus Margulisiibacteriota bacterium]